MMGLRVYIVGCEPERKDEFDKAEQVLSASGFRVYSVHNSCLPSSVSGIHRLRQSVYDLMACDGVYALEGWSLHQEGRILVVLASHIGMPVFNQQEPNDLSLESFFASLARHDGVQEKLAEQEGSRK